jgi:acyl carrier protein
MSDIYAQLAEILEVDEVRPSDVLADFPAWDSLAVLSVIAMLGEDYGINATAMELQNWKTAKEIADQIASRQSQ